MERGTALKDYLKKNEQIKHLTKAIRLMNYLHRVDAAQTFLFMLRFSETYMLAHLTRSSLENELPLAYEADLRRLQSINELHLTQADLGSVFSSPTVTLEPLACSGLERHVTTEFQSSKHLFQTLNGYYQGYIWWGGTNYDPDHTLLPPSPNTLSLHHIDARPLAPASPPSPPPVTALVPPYSTETNFDQCFSSLPGIGSNTLYRSAMTQFSIQEFLRTLASRGFHQQNAKTLFRSMGVDVPLSDFQQTTVSDSQALTSLLEASEAYDQEEDPEEASGPYREVPSEARGLFKSNPSWFDEPFLNFIKADNLHNDPSGRPQASLINEKQQVYGVYPSHNHLVFGLYDFRWMFPSADGAKMFARSYSSLIEERFKKAEVPPMEVQLPAGVSFVAMHREANRCTHDSHMKKLDEPVKVLLQSILFSYRNSVSQLICETPLGQNASPFLLQLARLVISRVDFALSKSSPATPSPVPTPP